MYEIILKFLKFLFQNSMCKRVWQWYFHLGYDYETITDLLQVYHSITMSVCTLKRRLQIYNLVKRKINTDEALVRNIIGSEMQRPGQLAGYRWHIL